MIVTRGLGSPLLVTQGYGGVLVDADLVPPFDVQFRTLVTDPELMTAIVEVVIVTPSGATVLRTPVPLIGLTTERLQAAVRSVVAAAGFETPTGSLVATTVKVDTRLRTPPGSTTFGT